VSLPAVDYSLPNEDLAAAAAEELRRRAQVELLRRARVKAQRDYLYEFVRAAWAVYLPGTPFEDGPHVEALCFNTQAQLEDRARAVDPSYVPVLPLPPALPGELLAQNLGVNIPPRCLKSTIIAVFATLWAWLRWPSLSIFCLSVNPRVSQRDASHFIRIARSDWYQDTFRPEWTLTRDAMERVENSAGGCRVARGIESNVVGEGCDWQIVDDPHDIRDSVDVIVAAVHDYVTAVYNRVNHPTKSIRTLIMQRVIEDDLSGYLQRDGGWHWLILRMEYETKPRPANDNMPPPAPAPYGWTDWRTVDGEILHPRFTRAFLDKERKRLLDDYDGQMQQHPTSAGGGTFKYDWFLEYEDSELPRNKRTGELEFDEVAMSVDCAVKKTEHGSEVAIHVYGRKNEKVFLLDADTKPRDFNETVDDMVAMRAKWPQITAVLVEAKANGPAAVNSIRRESKWMDIVEIETGADSKEGRASSVKPIVRAKTVRVPKRAAWKGQWLYRVCTFPKGRKDDDVDAMVQLLIHWRGDASLDESMALASW
jgi:predicted phage terminase large subunit-like protein